MGHCPDSVSRHPLYGISGCRFGAFLYGLPKKLVPRKAIFIELAGQGIPASLNMMSIAVGVFVITFFVSVFCKESVAAYGIASRIEQSAPLPSFGLTTAALSIVGQNDAARKFDRFRETVNKSILCGISIMTAGVFCFANPLMELFTTDPAVIPIGAIYPGIAAFMFQACIILYVSVVSCLQGMKKPLYAIWVGLYRKIAAPLLIFFGRVHLLGLGIVSVLGLTHKPKLEADPFGKSNLLSPSHLT